MMKRAGMIAVICLLAANGSVASGQAVRTWVATFGVDTNPCTRPEPCRTFHAALEVVSPGGEVVPLDSGGYGPFTVDKAVSILVPKGIHAAIATTNPVAIHVNAGAFDNVTLRGLFLTHLFSLSGGLEQGGILFLSGRALHVDDCTVRGFEMGINVEADSVASDVIITRSTLHGGDYGIWFANQSGRVNGVVKDCTLFSYGTAVVAGANSRVTVRNSVLSRNRSAAGFATGSGAAAGHLFVENSLISGNEGGLGNANDGVIRISNCSIVGNSVGVANDDPATTYSMRNNLISGNGVDVVGTIQTVTPQ